MGWNKFISWVGLWVCLVVVVGYESVESRKVEAEKKKPEWFFDGNPSWGIGGGGFRRGNSFGFGHSFSFGKGVGFSFGFGRPGYVQNGGGGGGGGIGAFNLESIIRKMIKGTTMVGEDEEVVVEAG
ncbi:hypothetical protein E1A91_A06G066100v1 [Gossypium mustelinum]|uniref:Uncharacterized protein n=1 Tax=Gossypium mustelinum TaxID=34275 RepID=A0A5D2YTW4_GOSMU|nr:hypothetical protein E1A91_A06G066100v1 [Gossypium mustelinum]